MTSTVTTPHLYIRRRGRSLLLALARLLYWANERHFPQRGAAPGRRNIGLFSSRDSGIEVSSFAVEMGGKAPASWLVLSAVLAVIASEANTKSLPSYITICNRSNKEELSKCGLKNTVDVQPHIANGIPELSLPPMDPLSIPQIKLEQGTQAVNYKCVLDNVKLHGLSQYKFLELDSEMDKMFYIKGKLSLPHIYLIADYEIDGKVLLVPISGKGIYRGNYTNTVSDVDIRSELVDKKGKQHLRVKSIAVKLTVGKTEGNFENLASGDSALNQATNTFLNENADELRDETLPAVQEVVAELVRKIMDQVFNTVPYEELFPK